MSILKLTIRSLIPRPLRNTLRRPSQTFLRAKQKVKYLLGAVENVEPVRGWKVRCHPICKEGFEVFSKDQEQMGEMTEFRRHCRPAMQLLDVGAHWGVFALAASHFSNRTARIVCLEPSPAAVKIIKTNVKLNDLDQKIQIVQAAAGAEDSDLQMLTTGAGGADYFVVPHEKRKDTVTVKQVSLAKLCTQLEFRPTHFKLDVEGFEEEALAGAIELLATCRPELFLELHGDVIRRRGKDPGAVLKLLTEVGYTRWLHNGKYVDHRGLEHLGFNARIVCLRSEISNK